ncbi:hypothetical protein LINGRAHAP2_LOCUS11985 [Linum grandiflorum]
MAAPAGTSRSRRGAATSSSSSASAAVAAAAPPAASRGWVKNLPSIASRIYFFLIILQVPLFSKQGSSVRTMMAAGIESESQNVYYYASMCYDLRVFITEMLLWIFCRVPCRSGMCTSPIHVTSSQLIASDIFPVPVVKALLYPGAVVNGLVVKRTVPSWNSVLDIYNLTTVKDASAVTDLQRLEVLAGSYFSVAGALVGILKPGRMSMFGTLLILWGLIKEGILGKPVNTDPTRSIYVYPTIALAVICAFSSVKYDMKKVAAKKSGPARPIATPLQSSSKSKLK